MKRPFALFLAIVIFGLVLLVCFYQHDRGLWSSHEARAGQIVCNMMLSGDYLNQTLHTGQPSYQKPPLFYWAGCAFARIRGQLDAVALRLPSTVSAAVTVLIIFAAGTKLGSPGIGLVSALVLMTSIRFWWQGQLARIDMLLAALVVAAGLCFYVGYHHRRCRVGWYLLAYALTGAGVLAKGPVAVALVGSGIGLYILFDRNWSEAAAVVLAWVLFLLMVGVGYLLGPAIATTYRHRDGGAQSVTKS